MPTDVRQTTLNRTAGKSGRKRGLKASSAHKRSVVWDFDLRPRLTAMIRPTRSDASDQQAAFLHVRASLPAQTFAALLAPGAAP